MQAIKIDFISNTIKVTKGFMELASDMNTEEYRTLQQAKNENPQMRVVYRNQGAAGHKNENKGLTYKYMRRFIIFMDKENLPTFEAVSCGYELLGYETGAIYHKVREWFLEQYPNHKQMIVDSISRKAETPLVEAA